MHQPLLHIDNCATCILLHAMDIQYCHVKYRYRNLIRGIKLDLRFFLIHKLLIWGLYECRYTCNMNYQVYIDESFFSVRQHDTYFLSLSEKNSAMHNSPLFYHHVMHGAGTGTCCMPDVYISGVKLVKFVSSLSIVPCQRATTLLITVGKFYILCRP